jgi:hypothetical protein
LIVFTFSVICAWKTGVLLWIPAPILPESPPLWIRLGRESGEHPVSNSMAALSGG